MARWVRCRSRARFLPRRSIPRALSGARAPRVVRAAGALRFTGSDARRNVAMPRP